jgi:hypothetical protein
VAADDSRSRAASGLTRDGRQLGCRNGMGWEREIRGPKQNYGEEFELL